MIRPFLTQWGQTLSLPFSILALALSAVALAGCGTTDLSKLTEHLNARGCATVGSANASAGLTGAQLAGNVSWRCPAEQRELRGPQAATEEEPAADDPLGDLIPPMAAEPPSF